MEPKKGRGRLAESRSLRMVPRDSRGIDGWLFLVYRMSEFLRFRKELGEPLVGDLLLAKNMFTACTKYMTKEPSMAMLFAACIVAEPCA